MYRFFLALHHLQLPFLLFQLMFKKLHTCIHFPRTPPLLYDLTH
jgi:hypothetical protein